MFEGLWNDGIDAEIRIRDIEKGIDSANIEIIQNPHERLNHAWSLVRFAKEEILIMCIRRQTAFVDLEVLSDE